MNYLKDLIAKEKDFVIHIDQRKMTFLLVVIAKEAVWNLNEII